MYSAETVIAILVDRLGGEVSISDYEFAADGLELQALKSVTEFAYRFRTRRRLEQIDGEVVTASAIAAQIIASAVPVDEYFANEHQPIWTPEDLADLYADAASLHSTGELPVPADGGTLNHG